MSEQTRFAWIEAVDIGRADEQEYFPLLFSSATLTGYVFSIIGIKTIFGITITISRAELFEN